MTASQSQLSKANILAPVTALNMQICGSDIICDHSGVLYLPDHKTLVVSDLHLEKGAAAARSGLLHPPYDTQATLKRLGASIEFYEPQMVISLGDSFHDRQGAALMPLHLTEKILTLQLGRDWIWIAGNHDPEAPVSLGGEYLEEFEISNLCFRHEPKAGLQSGEISGHLHPAARISRKGASIKRSCFATDGNRLIMPAFGETTGGLSLKHKAFHGLFDKDKLQANVIGKHQIYPIKAKSFFG